LQSLDAAKKNPTEPPSTAEAEAQDDGSGTLRKTAVKIFEPQFGGSEVVLDQREGTGACNGDSGGPAYILVNGQLQLFGITSRGNVTCDVFAVYTNILAHQKFIELGIAKLQAPIEF
jgi:secreted trypsin-like serine protease